MSARKEPPPLTRRQLQIMRMVQDGLTNVQIAHRMQLSAGTVRTHLNNIYARLQVSGRAAAIQKVFGVGDAWP
jgi:DNA-binding NarL/FixJ family response regulator